MKRLFDVDQLVDAAAHGGVAGQQRQWIGMFGRLQLLFGDQAQHVDGLAEAVIAAILGDDELFGEPRPALLRHQAAHLLQPQLAVDEQRRRLHHRGHRLLVEDFRVQRFGQQIEQSLTPHHAQRPSFLHDRERELFGIVTEQFGELR